MINRRKFLASGASALALAGVGALAGCSPRSAPGNIRYWGISGDNAKNEQKILDAFAQTDAGRNVTITKSTVPSSGTGDATSVITAVRGGTAPDVWFMDRFSAVQYASLGLLEPIDGMIKKYGDDVDDIKKRTLPFANDELTYNGKLYGLPTETDTRALYYNTEMVRGAGVDLDELDPANGPLSVQRVVEISDKLIKKDKRGNYTRLGLIPWDGEGWGYTWSLGKGATFFDDGNCSVNIVTDETIAAYEFLYERARTLDFPKVDAFKATYQPPNAPPAQTSFYSGRQGFMISGPFFQFAMRKYVPDLKFGVTYLPIFEKGDDPYTWSGGFSLVCPKGSSMSADVWEFMKFYTSARAQSIYMPRAYTLPTSLEVLRNSQNPVFTKDLKIFIDLLPYSTSRPPFPVSQLWWDSMAQAQGNVTIGSRTPKAALEAGQARVAPQMQLYCPFKMPAGYGKIGQAT